MTDDKPAAAYLRRLKRASQGMPRARRQELLREIADHIDQASAQAGGSGPAALRNVLDQLGEPEDIAAAAGAPGRGGRLGGWEIAAVILLLLGGFLWLIGWVAGVILLWISPRWRWPDKLLGTLVWPGGLLAPVFVAGLAWAMVGGFSACGGSTGIRTVCPGGSGLPPWLGIAILVVSVAAPILVSIRLVRRARRALAQEPPASAPLIRS